MSGTAVGEQRYYPFGATRAATGTMGTDRLFTGQRTLAELGIYHFNARFYSGTLGRFLSADPLVPEWTNPQSLNRYAYVVNNPLRFTDPFGFSYCDSKYAFTEDCVEAGVVSTRTPLPIGSVRSAVVTASNDYCTWLPWECGGSSDSHEIPAVYGVPQESVCVGLACDIRQDGLPGGSPTAQASPLSGGIGDDKVDYRVLSFGTPLPIPYTANVIGWHVTLATDEYGQWFLGLGLEIDPGQAVQPFTANWVSGYHSMDRPLSIMESNSFLSGLSYQIFVIPFLYMGGNFSPGNGGALEVGAGAPALGGGFTYSWRIVSPVRP